MCVCGQRFVLSRQRTPTCDCPCRSATRAATPSSPWPRTTKTSSCPRTCSCRGRARASLLPPNLPSPVGETSPTQSELKLGNHQICVKVSFRGVLGGGLRWSASTCRVSLYRCETHLTPPGELVIESSAERSGVTRSLSLASAVRPRSSLHKADDEVENPRQMMINSEL